MDTPSHKLLAIPPSYCCCTSLNPSLPFSSWKRSISWQRMKCPQHLSRKKHHNVFSPVQENYHYSSNNPTTKLIISSPKHLPASASNDSRNPIGAKLFSRCKIPYPFSHQLSSRLAIKDYCNTHTYPMLQKCQVNTHSSVINNTPLTTNSVGSSSDIYYARKHFAPLSGRHLANARSHSEPLITTVLQPKTLILEEYRGRNATYQNRKHLNKERLASHRVITGSNHSIKRDIAVTKPKSASAAERSNVHVSSTQPLRVRWSSHSPLPSFVVRPSKSVNHHSERFSKRHDLLKSPKKVPLTNTSSEQHETMTDCNVVQPETEINTMHLQYPCIKYSNMAIHSDQYKSLGAGVRWKGSTKPGKNGNLPKSITITTPWDHKRN